MGRAGATDALRRWAGTLTSALATAAIVATLALATPSPQGLPKSSAMADRLIGSAQIRDGSLLLRDIKRGQLESRFLTISAAAAKYVKISDATARHLAAVDPGPYYLKLSDAEKY